MAKIWVGGEWREAEAVSAFQAENPSTGEKLERWFPVSGWSDCERALAAAAEAAPRLEEAAPERIAAFLEAYALGLAAAADTLAAAAHEETGLAFSPRLKDVELPRTIDQLRQAAKAAREGTWRRVTIDRQRNLRSCLGPIGPVVIFGPNNFAFAFNEVSGGDFAAAIAAGNPVIGKAHPLHPHTSRLLAEEATKALAGSGLPEATVQMLYHVEPETGLKLVSDRRIGAVAFTGSKAGGLALKRAADAAGKPIYLEMSSLNPVVFLPEGMKEDGGQWAGELTESCTAGVGQFCTRPNLVFMFAGDASEKFLENLAEAFDRKEPTQPMLSSAVWKQLDESIAKLRKAGAQLVCGGKPLPGPGYRYSNSLLRITGDRYLDGPETFQHEAFGNEVLAVTVKDEEQLVRALESLEGNLTASIYSSRTGADEALYRRVAPVLRKRSGRMLNDKMPTGVAVSPAMNHGGPYPATGHPGFTAIGLPTSIARFTALYCYENVREERLPRVLQTAQ